MSGANRFSREERATFTDGNAPSAAAFPPDGGPHRELVRHSFAHSAPPRNVNLRLLLTAVPAMIGANRKHSGNVERVFRFSLISDPGDSPSPARGRPRTFDQLIQHPVEVGGGLVGHHPAAGGYLQPALVQKLPNRVLFIGMSAGKEKRKLSPFLPST